MQPTETFHQIRPIHRIPPVSAARRYRQKPRTCGLAGVLRSDLRF